MFTVSQATVEKVLSDIYTGAADDFVASFFANRPDWQETDDTANQTDSQEEKKAETK